jgi:MFS family permease
LKTALPELSVYDRERAMALSRFDAITYAAMVGLGEAYFLADAVRLGATASEIALLVGLPLALGASGPILALRLLTMLGRRKPIVVAAAAAQAGMLFLLAALDATGAMGPRLLIAAAVVYQICAQAAGTAWSSWYGDLVPAGVRGRYFASRNRGAYAGTVLGLLGSGLLLTWLEPVRAGVAGAAGGEGGVGYAIAYLLAGVFRCVSVGTLAASREGRFSGMPDRARVGRFLRTQRGSGAWRLVLLVGALQVAVYVASPFFNPYMLQSLDFSYVEYMIASAWLVGIKVLMLPLWGRQIDRHGARTTLVRGGLILALVPLPWILVRDLWGAMFCMSLSGTAWAGFEVGHFSLLLELGYRRMRPTVFAAQSVVTGSSQLVGSLLGGKLLALVDPRIVFAASGGLRIAVALLLVRLLPRGRPGVRIRPEFRVTGFRAGTGMAQRPVLESDVEGAGGAESEPRPG